MCLCKFDQNLKYITTFEEVGVAHMLRNCSGIPSCYFRLLGTAEDLDEMPHVVAFHQGLHCVLAIERNKNKKLKKTCSDLSIYTYGPS